MDFRFRERLFPAIDDFERGRDQQPAREIPRSTAAFSSNCQALSSTRMCLFTVLPMPFSSFPSPRSPSLRSVSFSGQTVWEPKQWPRRPSSTFPAFSDEALNSPMLSVEPPSRNYHRNKLFSGRSATA